MAALAAEARARDLERLLIQSQAALAEDGRQNGRASVTFWPNPIYSRFLEVNQGSFALKTKRKTTGYPVFVGNQGLATL